MPKNFGAVRDEGIGAELGEGVHFLRGVDGPDPEGEIGFVGECHRGWRCDLAGDAEAGCTEFEGSLDVGGGEGSRFMEKPECWEMVASGVSDDRSIK